MKPKAKVAKKERVVFNPTEKELTETLGDGSIITRRRGKFAHYCYEYDDMLIDEHDPEFANCLCGTPNPKT